MKCPACGARRHRRDEGCPPADFFYFGCRDRGGHFLWRPGAGRTSDEGHRLPWKRLDGNLAPGCDDDEQPEGLGRLHHRDGWTAWAFWDRTYDRRGNSNSVFLFKGTHTLEEMQSLAKSHFPDVWARVSGLSFRIVEDS